MTAEASRATWPIHSHTLSIAGQSFLLNANGSNFGSAFIILDPYTERGDHDRYETQLATRGWR